ncbi:hypothetical protein FSZ31_00870 [Sphingorhabdus soli]|uniref:Uncharacterized protein n=1 Tax=Flavisphingopyxis soli TaxID=2601267 RepID=A0A5C6UML5_9SPHN|nr:hypothetical protein [Sphingorhabdus soli]TXC73351.1 hypothetical protein FSZ31_00870 [Sphingorhabdus soli]
MITLVWRPDRRDKAEWIGELVLAVTGKDGLERNVLCVVVVYSTSGTLPRDAALAFLYARSYARPFRKGGLAERAAMFV